MNFSATRGALHCIKNDIPTEFVRARRTYVAVVCGEPRAASEVSLALKVQHVGLYQLQHRIMNILSATERPHDLLCLLLNLFDGFYDYFLWQSIKRICAQIRGPRIRKHTVWAPISLNWGSSDSFVII